MSSQNTLPTEGSLSRRSFCRWIGLAAAAPLVTLPLAGTPATFRLRYILASSMYGTMKLADILPEARKVGADVIDIWPLRHGDQREQMEAMGHERFAGMLEQHKLKLGILTRYDLGPFQLQEEMKVGNKFGAKLLITSSRGPKDLTGDTLKAEVKKFVEQLKPHLAVAEANQVCIGIENHGGGLIASPDSIRWLAEFSPSKHLCLALAPYHLDQDAPAIGKLIEDLGGRLGHFYAWQHGKGATQKLPKDEELLQMPGRGALDFVPIIRALRKINYQGWTEPFMHPTPRGIPILESLPEVTAEINRARGYLDACAAKV